MTPILVITTAFITAIFGPIIVEWIKLKFFYKKLKVDILGESIIKDEKIDHQLEILLEELKCDRICITQFHNEGHFFPTGKSIKNSFMSISSIILFSFLSEVLKS